VLRDLDGSGSTIADYLNGPGIDNKLRQTSGGTALYFIQDHLATTRALADASGDIATNLTYDSFGNLLTGSISTRYTYTGREIDTDTGLMYYRERWYDAQQGRFISEDPIGFDGGLNFYGYVENSPMSLSDPSGLCPPDGNKTARCAALVRRMFGPLDEMKRLLPNYDPAKEFFGGYPIRKRLPGGELSISERASRVVTMTGSERLKGHF
jgi:RHS repeat-associated protein